VPAVKLLSIVTDTKKTVIGLMFLPKHEITDKERATAQMIAASHQMYSIALVDLKEWKNVHGKDSTYIETLYERQNMRSSWL
jgi:hypothetical protein